jgi:16S rRNA processing protein RimM
LLAFLFFDWMKKESFIKIGYVMKTHGLKGEVTLKLNPDSPEIEPQSVLMVELETGQVPYFVEQASYKGNQVFVKLEEVNSIEQSEQLKGRSIFIEKTSRPKLKRGEFYDDEMVGMEVWDGEVNLGVVGQVINQGFTRFLEVGERNVLIPINGPFIKSISKTKKRIEVELPEGFLDI